MDRRGLVNRLTGRRVCSSCGAVYHIANNPSKVEGLCDKCSGQLILRSDDREDVILSRLDTYEAVADALKKYYDGFGVMVEVNGDQSVDDVYRSIVSSAKIVER